LKHGNAGGSKGQHISAAHRPKNNKENNEKLIQMKLKAGTKRIILHDTSQNGQSSITKPAWDQCSLQYADEFDYVDDMDW